MADYRHMTIEERIEYHKQQIALHENSINALEGLLCYNDESEKELEEVESGKQMTRFEEVEVIEVKELTKFLVKHNVNGVIIGTGQAFKDFIDHNKLIKAEEVKADVRFID